MFAQTVAAPVKTTLPILRRLMEPVPVPALLIPGLFLLAVVILVFTFRNGEGVKRVASRIPWPVHLLFGIFLVCGLGVFPGLLLYLTGLLVIELLHKVGELIVFLVLCLAIIAAGALYVVVGSFFVEFWPTWYVVLGSVLFVAFVFIGSMYYYDSRSVHPLWATLLGLLRVGVYLLLTVCFLLPGCQEYTTTSTDSKVLVLFDISGSMDAVDGQDDGGVTRQEKIIRFLTTAYRQGNSDKMFMEHLTDNSQVACYRFGLSADDEPVVFDGKTKPWTADQWREWFKADPTKVEIPASLTDPKQREAYKQAREAMLSQIRDGTDVGGSVLQILQREGSNRIQAIIIVSDGNSNRGDEEAIRQLAERASSSKRPIHVITVGVGDYKQPVRIRINPLIAPQDVRADDGAFEVRVPVFGDGLPGEEFEVTLEVQRVKDRTGVATKNDQVYKVGTQKGKFGGGGEFPYDEVVFKVNLEQLTKIKADEDTKGQLQGQWDFIAKVPRNPREAADKTKPIHVSMAKPVIVRDSTLRVLLFASGPSRDYQFVRTLMGREVDAKRAKCAVYLQTAKGLDDVNQDVPILPDFPTKLERPKDAKGKDAGSREGDPMNLKSYDVIICFDPDWTELTRNQKELFREWCEGDHGGGVIFVAGPQHTLRLIPPVDEQKFKAWDLKPIYTLFPVILARPPAGVKADSLHDSTIPYPLDFTAIAKAYDFIKLDDESPIALGGWKEFFGKFVATKFPGGDKIHPERGFFNYLQVKKAKDGAEVIATFGDPKAPKVDKGGQPYFVALRVGKGKTFYIGSGEMWRLRTYKEDYHQRFWVKLARYVSSGSGGKTFGRFAMAGEYVTGIIPIEAEVKDKDGFALNQDSPPLVLIRKVAGAGDDKDDKQPKVQLKPKKTTGQWRGVFTGSIRLDKEGFYEARIDIPGTDESITQTFEIKSPNVEMSDLRTNFPKLYNMATDAPQAMLNRLDVQARERLEGGKDRPKAGPDGKLEVGAGARLFFRLASGQTISQCITRVPAESETTKGRIKDLWDQGPEVFNAKSWDEYRLDVGAFEIPLLVVAMFGVPGVVLAGVTLMMLLGRRWFAALGVWGTMVLVEIGIFVLILFTTPMDVFQPSAFGVLLIVPPLIALVAGGILLIAERYFWVLGVIALTVVYLGLLFAVQLIFWPDWPPMKVDFSWMLIAIGVLLSLEWFTRKMLRLA